MIGNFDFTIMSGIKRLAFKINKNSKMLCFDILNDSKTQVRKFNRVFYNRYLLHILSIKKHAFSK